MQRDTLIALSFSLFFVVLLGASFYMRAGGDRTPSFADVTYDADRAVQVIDISANGGYSPRKVTARAGVATELRVATNGTYDCSASLLIPELDYRKTLSPTGTETIALTSEQATGTLRGTCSMGMYDFVIEFTEGV